MPTVKLSAFDLGMQRARTSVRKFGANGSGFGFEFEFDFIVQVRLRAQFGLGLGSVR
ncbi:unnamed protein product, partial [Rotaria magnacalcarata]